MKEYPTYNETDTRFGTPNTYPAQSVRSKTRENVRQHDSISAKRKKIYAAGLILLTAFSLFFATAMDPQIETEAVAASPGAESIFAGGAGTSGNPYLISDATQLQAFRNSVNSGNTYEDKYIALSSNINIAGMEWTPIGASTRTGSNITADSTPFKGSFDGRGYTIAGLTITSAGAGSRGADYALGLFGAVLKGSVSNLTLSDINIDAPDSELAGGAVGLLTDGGSVSGVATSGSIKTKCDTGGIVGRMTANGSIANCTNEAAVEISGGSGNCGGIVGAAYYTPADSRMSISGCVNKGAVTGVNDTGGIAGLCCAFVSNCTNDGPVNGNGYAVGGIAGEIKNYGGINHCTNNADIINSTSNKEAYGTGGIVGWVRYSGAPPAYVESAPASIINNINTGNVEAPAVIGVGGIAGVVYSAGTVSGNDNRASKLSGNQFVAGIVGDLQVQDSALPSTVKEGAVVTKNVSTTPLSDITGNFTDLYAYNNDSSVFEVSDNSPKPASSDENVSDAPFSPSLNGSQSSSANDIAKPQAVTKPIPVQKEGAGNTAGTTQSGKAGVTPAPTGDNMVLLMLLLASACTFAIGIMLVVRSRAK